MHQSKYLIQINISILYHTHYFGGTYSIFVLLKTPLAHLLNHIDIKVIIIFSNNNQSDIYFSAHFTYTTVPSLTSHSRSTRYKQTSILGRNHNTMKSNKITFSLSLYIYMQFQTIRINQKYGNISANSTVCTLFQDDNNLHNDGSILIILFLVLFIQR